MFETINPLFSRLRRRFFGGAARSPLRLPRGIREVILAYNANCDTRCATADTQGQFLNCITRAQANNSRVIRLLNGCTNSLNCDRRQRKNRCLIRRSISRRNLVSPRLQRCFRFSLNIATLDCLIRRNRILRRLLPLPRGPAGPVG